MRSATKDRALDQDASSRSTMHIEAPPAVLLDALPLEPEAAPFALA
jgi:hypothetical protein